MQSRDMILRNAISYGSSFVFLLQNDGESQKVCIEHLDQLTAAVPDIWTRPDQRKRPIAVINLSCLIFSRNHAFPGRYAFACNIRRCFGNYEKQQRKNARKTFFLASVTHRFCNLGRWVTMFDYVALYFISPVMLSPFFYMSSSVCFLFVHWPVC